MDLDKSLNLESGFRYPTIDASTQIRLLRPKGAPGDLDFVFKIVPLNRLSSIRYRALSYTWGRVSTLPDLHTIHIHDQPFLVRQNLFDFLTTNPFADTSEGLVSVGDDKENLIFIDALCINQFDDAERQAQIQLMTHIYRRADQVIAWLGQPSPSLLPAIQALAAASSTQSATSWTAAQTSAHHHLSHSHYWTRVWVLQELLLASRVTIRCGPSSFPLDLFSPASQTKPNYYLRTPAERTTSHRLRHHLSPAHDPLAGGTTILPLSTMLSLLSQTTTWEVTPFLSPLPDSLHEILTQYGCHLSCSDSRDKLYGFLGLLHEDTRSQITVDYSQGVEFAFYQALKVGLGELAREAERDFAGGMYWAGDLDSGLGLNRRWIRRFYDCAREAFEMGDEEGEKVLKRVARELKLEEWLGEVEWVVIAHQEGGGRVGGVPSLSEFQKVREGEVGEGRERIGKHGGKGWLERMHEQQERAAAKVGKRFSKARVRLLKV